MDKAHHFRVGQPGLLVQLLEMLDFGACGSSVFAFIHEMPGIWQDVRAMRRQPEHLIARKRTRVDLELIEELDGCGRRRVLVTRSRWD